MISKGEQIILIVFISSNHGKIRFNDKKLSAEYFRYENSAFLKMNYEFSNRFLMEDLSSVRVSSKYMQFSIVFFYRTYLQIKYQGENALLNSTYIILDNRPQIRNIIFDIEIMNAFFETYSIVIIVILYIDRQTHKNVICAYHLTFASTSKLPSSSIISIYFIYFKYFSGLLLPMQVCHCTLYNNFV